MRKEISAFILILWFLSFLLSIPFAEPHELFRLAAIVSGFAGFGLALWQGLSRPLEISSRPVLILSALSFWGLLGLSLAWTPSLLPGVITFATFSLFPMAFLSVILMNPIREQQQRIMPGASLLSALLGIWVLLQYFIFTDYLVMGAIRYPFADPNNYAGLLNLGLFMTLPQIMRSEGKRRIFFTTCACLIVIAIITIGGRAAMAATMLALSVFLWFSRSYRKECLVILAIVIISAMAGFAGTQIFSDTRLTALGRLSLLQDFDHVSMTSRIDLLKSTITMIMQHPWRGTGLGTYFLFYPEYRLPTEQGSAGLMAHNDPLQFWAEAGIGAVILFYTFVGAAFIRMKRYLKIVPPDNPARLTAAGCFCALGSLVFHAHLTFHFYVAALLVATGLILGLWYRQTAESEDRHITLPALPEGRSVIIILILVCSLWPIQGLIRSEYLVNRGAQALIDGDIGQFGRDINAAGKAGWGLNARAYLHAAMVPMALLQDRVQSPAPGEKENLALQAEELLRKAAQANPRLSSIPYHRGLIAEAENRQTEAFSFYENSLKLAPQYLPARLALIRFYEKSGRPDDAYGLMIEGLPWPYYLYDPRSYFDHTLSAALKRGDHVTVSKVMDRKAAFAYMLRDAGITEPLARNQNPATEDPLARTRMR